MITQDKENCIYLRDPEIIKQYDTSNYSRIYFGNEFCEHLIPSFKELKVFLDYCSKYSLSLTFVTPHCTDWGISKLEKIFAKLPQNNEVVINDWGVLSLVDFYNLKPICGRSLLAGLRDPRLIRREYANDFSKITSANQELFQHFLLSRGIERFEIDNVRQGYSFKTHDKLSVSLHYPFVTITTSRKCLTANHTTSLEKNRIEISKNCNFECSSISVHSRIGKDGPEILLRGNSQFYINNDLDLLADWSGVNRLVYLPQLPFSHPFSSIKNQQRNQWSQPNDL